MKETFKRASDLQTLIVLSSACWFIVGCNASTSTNNTPPSTRVSELVPLSTAAEAVHWSQNGFDERRASFNPREAVINPANVGELSLLWTQRYSSSIRGYTSITEDKAFFGLYGGQFYAVEAATGNTIWKVENKRKHMGQCVADGVVYSSWTDRVSAFDINSGDELWTWRPMNEGSMHGPLLADGILYLGTGSREIVRLEAKSGKRLAGILSTRSIAIDGDVAYAITADMDRLQALDLKTEQIMWEKPLERAKQTSHAVVNSGVVVVATDVGRVHAFDARIDSPTAGALLWTGETKPNAAESVQSPAIAYGKVFFGKSDTFYCYDLKGSGVIQKPLWTAKTGSDFFSGSSPSVANGVVYTTCGVDEVIAYDVFNGAELWSYKIVGSGHPIRSKVTVAAGRVFVPCTFAFRLMVFHLP